MTRIEITRTELVWPGKYDEEGNLAQVERVNLPFQCHVTAKSEE